MRLFLILWIAMGAGAMAGAAECTSNLKTHEGVWRLTAGENCPAKLEMRCLRADDSERDSFFVDEIKSDSTPGAQIYFNEIAIQGTRSENRGGRQEKEYSIYDVDSSLLVSATKDCSGILGCLANSDVKNRLRFAEEAAVLERIWGEEVSCGYQRETPNTTLINSL